MTAARVDVIDRGGMFVLWLRVGNRDFFGDETYRRRRSAQKAAEEVRAGLLGGYEGVAEAEGGSRRPRSLKSP